MEGETRPAARAGRPDPLSRGPGRRELSVFLALAFAGFATWFAGSPGVASVALGVDLPGWPQDVLPLALLFAPVACGALALVFGFALPGGFYLWGAALALHGPFVQALKVYVLHREGIDALVGGAQGIANYVGFSAAVFVFQVLYYTALSSAGAGARYLFWQIARR